MTALLLHTWPCSAPARLLFCSFKCGHGVGFWPARAHRPSCCSTAKGRGRVCSPCVVPAAHPRHLTRSLARHWPLKRVMRSAVRLAACRTRPGYVPGRPVAGRQLPCLSPGRPPPGPRNARAPLRRTCGSSPRRSLDGAVRRGARGRALHMLLAFVLLQPLAPPARTRAASRGPARIKEDGAAARMPCGPMAVVACAPMAMPSAPPHPGPLLRKH